MQGMNGEGFCVQTTTLPTGIAVCTSGTHGREKTRRPPNPLASLTSSGSNPDSLAWLLLVMTVCTFLSALLSCQESNNNLPASWFIPPPYVQLSVCMTIKNKATYIMALKHVTNQLCPLSYYNISKCLASMVCREGQTQPDHTGD